jgi:hypothetical protein
MVFVRNFVNSVASKKLLIFDLMKLLVLLILAVIFYSYCSPHVGSAKGYRANSRFATSDIAVQEANSYDHVQKNVLWRKRKRNTMQLKKLSN